MYGTTCIRLLEKKTSTRKMSMLNFIVVVLVIRTSSASDSTPSHQHDSLVTTPINHTTNSVQVTDTCLEFNPQSCVGVCGQFFSLWCSCDEYCQVYGRCCFDYQTVCKEESEKARRDHENLMNVTIECDINISGYFIPQQIITSCPPTNVTVEIVELCQEETKPSALVSKVMSKRSLLHYKNLYCMLCNGEVDEDAVYWSTRIGTTNRREKPNNLQNMYKLFQNPIKIIPPPNSREIICFPQVISSCVTHATPVDQGLCQENAMSPIKHNQKVYKNTFCLQCNGVLQPDDGLCSPAEKPDINYYGTYENSFVLSMILNWDQNRKASITLNHGVSYIKEITCSLDSHDNLKGCEVDKCVGTLPVINNTCELMPNHFGCLWYVFKINFTIPVESTSEAILDHISSKLVKFSADLERMYNVTEYFSRDIQFSNITIDDENVSGFIHLKKMAYNLCFLELRYLTGVLYWQYLDDYLDLDLNGSITTCRYSIKCINWCDNTNDLNACSILYTKYFTGNFQDISEIDLDLASSATKSTLLCIYMPFLMTLFKI